MTRFSDTTRFSLSLLFFNLARLSLSSTLHLCKSLASKTLALFAMDDLFPNDDDFWDLDVASRSRPPQRPRLLDDYDYDDNERDKVYFVPYRYSIPCPAPAPLFYCFYLVGTENGFGIFVI